MAVGGTPVQTGWRLGGGKERVGTGAVGGGASPPSSVPPPLQLEFLEGSWHLLQPGWVLSEAWLLGSCSAALPLIWGRRALRRVVGWKGSFS